MRILSIEISTTTTAHVTIFSTDGATADSEHSATHLPSKGAKTIGLLLLRQICIHMPSSSTRISSPIPQRGYLAPFLPSSQHIIKTRVSTPVWIVVGVAAGVSHISLAFRRLCPSCGGVAAMQTRIQNQCSVPLGSVANRKVGRYLTAPRSAPMPNSQLAHPAVDPRTTSL